MPPRGRDLRERCEDEAAIRKTRMRKDRIGAFSADALEIQEVDVDDPGAVAEGRDAPELLFDFPGEP